MLLSIVIPTYNRVRLLPRTIEALSGLETAEDVAYEVIFVDNGSTDATPALMEETVLQYPETFRYVRIAPTGGPSAPRNTGIRAARGEAIVILDDDVVPHKDLVVSYAEFHRKYPEQHHAAVGEAYVPKWLSEDPMAWLHELNYGEMEGRDRLSYVYFWTCNVSVKRDFMLKEGMFDERFLFFEDILCAYWMEQRGMHLHFWPTARGQHLHQMTPHGLEQRGLYVGRWLYPFLEKVNWDKAALLRLHVLSKKLPAAAYWKRLVGRAIFRLRDNPLAMWALAKICAGQTKRSKLSDYYHATLFHRYMLAGYDEAKKCAEAGKPLNLLQLQNKVADRGDR